MIAVGVMFMTLGILGAILDRPDPAFPGDSWWVLQAPDALEIYSVDPGPEGFEPPWPHIGEVAGFQTYAKAEVRDRQTQGKLSEALLGEVVRHPTQFTTCVAPRHALRAERDGKVVTVLICFSCGYMEVRAGGKVVRSVIRGRSKPLFDETLRSLGVTPVPDQAEPGSAGAGT
jgi:hypothetical protein